VTAEPDWSKLPADVPASIVRWIPNALKKDLRDG
jgi:hypothetical protein